MSDTNTGRAGSSSTATDNPVLQFEALFGQNGGEKSPGNIGPDRDAYSICQQILNESSALLYSYFDKWENHDSISSRPLATELHLLNIGQWEAAWTLAQLHYDQVVKQEAFLGSRLHKGAPLCNLAIIAREIGSPTLSRHYALLSSAGDIYWQHELPFLAEGGYGPTMLEQFESRSHHNSWRDSLKIDLQNCRSLKHLEPFLAARWFMGKYATIVTTESTISSTPTVRPFTDILLDKVDKFRENQISAKHKSNDPNYGTLFEAASGLLLSSTPGFYIESARKTSDDQVDLVVSYKPDCLGDIGLEPGFGLVECKSSKGPVKVSELRDFGAKCLFHRVRFGILIARTGITGTNKSGVFKEPRNAELVRRRFQVDGLTILVLDMNQLRGKSRELRGLLDDLRMDYHNLVFGPICGSN